MDSPETSAAPAASAPPAAVPAGQRRVYCFVAFPGHRNRSWLQGLLAKHYPKLWEEIRVKWLANARAIAPQHIEDPERPDTLDYIRGYARSDLSALLISLGESGREWDGYEIGEWMKERHGWRTDFHLCALIHAWSTGLVRDMRSPS